MINRRRASGFTLTELVVAVAILVTISSGVMMLFVGSIRTVRQSGQSIDAFENARGALNVIERDLSTCFTSREHGEYFHFVGTPIGMTFVGMLKATNGATELGRVTYVLHEFGVGPPPVGGAEFDAEREDPPNSHEWVNVTVKTRAILRFVEMGVRDLDSYLIAWPDLQPDWINTPPGETGSPENNLWLELKNAVFRGGVNLDNFNFSDFPEYADWLGTSAETATLGQVALRAKKCELWIRMLAGDTSLPLAWNTYDPNTGAVIGVGFLNKSRLPEDYLEPGDYVLAENIAWRVETPDPPYVGYPGEIWTRWPLPDSDTEPPVQQWFSYGRTAIDVDTGAAVSDFSPFFNLEQNWIPTGALDALNNGDIPVFWNLEGQQDLVGDPLRPRLPELVEVNFSLMYPSAYSGAAEFNRGFQLTVAITQGLSRGTGETVVPANP